MKTMQDFYNWLTGSKEDAAFDRRLAALTGFSKARLAAAASADPWFWWEASQPPAAQA